MQRGPAGPGEARQVRVARVSEMPVGASVTVAGTLAAKDQATLSVKVPGRLVSIHAGPGSIVRRGQAVAQVEQQDYRLRIQQAEAALQQARARLGLQPDGSEDGVDPEKTATVRQARAVMDQSLSARTRTATLAEQGLVPRAEAESADAAYRAAVGRYQDAVEEIRERQALLSQRRTELALAKRALADTTVVAPFDGLVQERKVSAGDYLEAGAAVATVVRVNPLRFRGEVPEREAASVRAGQQVRLIVEGDGGLHAGRVLRLSPTNNSQQGRVIVVEAEIANKGSLRPGGTARAEIVTEAPGLAVTVPSNAVVTLAGVERVITVEGGKAVERPVTTGRRLDQWTEVLSGIGVGEPVILDPGDLRPGQPVNVVE